MPSCKYIPHTLYFYKPAGTSRGVLYEKLSYFLEYTDDEGKKIYGECGLLKGLSIDDKPGYKDKLLEVCKAMEKGDISSVDLHTWPSIQCGVEMVILAQKQGKQDSFFMNDFYEKGHTIPINGLIWMGEPTFMRKQIREKVEKNFRCIKMKVGALAWESERAILQELRDAGGESLIIRVDANGAWGYDDTTKEKMEFLHRIGVHSIEQPVAVDKLADMQKLVTWSPVDIALDEELFQYHTRKSRADLLDMTQVEYIVLKPSLVGGFSACDEWISLAKERNIGYWLTSALESNVALNAIAQYSFPHSEEMFQGLGTGSLYENNIDSPLEIVEDTIRYNAAKSWDYSMLYGK